MKIVLNLYSSEVILPACRSLIGILRIGYWHCYVDINELVLSGIKELSSSMILARKLLHHYGSHYCSARRYKRLTSLWQGRQEWGRGRILLGLRNRQGSWPTCRGRCCPRVALQSRRSAHPRLGTAPLPTWHLRRGREDCKDANIPLEISS